MKNSFRYIATFAAFFAAVFSSGNEAFAQNLPDGTYIEQDGIAYRKSAIHNEDGTYTIDLETFVTGKVTYSESADPCDIVLVLDMSGSMNESIISYEYDESNVHSITAGNFNWNTYTKSTDYWIKYEDSYYQLNIGRARRNNNSYYYFLFFTVNGTRYHINRDGQIVNQEPHELTQNNADLLNDNVQLYTRRQVSSTTKIDALKAAVKGFIKEVEKNAYYDKKGNLRDTPLDNQISIVKFAGHGNNNPAYYDGNDQYEPAGTGNTRGNHRNGSGYNYTEVFRGLTSVLNGGADGLVSNIDLLVAGGATAANGGMQLALNIINQIPASRWSNKTVVFFTDGEPTYQSGFSNTVANGAIYNSNEIKIKTYTRTKDGKEETAHPSVFSVGVFDEAPVPGEDIYDFMDRVSSDYSNATTMTNNTATKESSDFYKDASGGAADLEDIFKAIAGSASSSDSAIGESSVVTVDVVAGSFSLPLNASADDVTVLVAPCTGKTNIGGTDYLVFGDPKAPEEYGLPSIDVDVSESDKTVSTTGFDYSANFCGPDESTTPISYRGYKQIIQFKINVRDDAVGGPNVATNDKASGIYVDGKQLAEFNRPTVKIPVQIWIQKQGLQGDDSAVFTLYCSPFEGFNFDDPEANTWTAITKIIINNDNMVEVTDDDGNIVKVVKQTGLDPDYFYRIKEDVWAFGYQYQNDGITYTVGDNIKNPFVIVNTPKDVVFDEADVRNIFKKKE